MKKTILFLVVSLSLGLVACNTAEKKNETAIENLKIAEEAKGQNMIGGEVIGEGEVYLVNQSGTTEDDNILYIKYDKEALLLQIGYESKDIDGSVPTIIYIDGEEIEQLQLGNSQGSIDLAKSNLDKGLHNVEFIQKDGDTTVFYRLAQYEVK